MLSDCYIQKMFFSKPQTKKKTLSSVEPSVLKNHQSSIEYRSETQSPITLRTKFKVVQLAILIDRFHTDIPDQPLPAVAKKRL